MENYYLVEYDEDEDEYIVYFGNTEHDEFNAAWIAAFIRKDDANEYVDFKNDQIDRVPNELPDNDPLLDPDWDDPMVDDLLEQFDKTNKDFYS